MRIALLQPCFWPEVRRGSERLVHDLSSALADRGHGVTLITSHAGPTAVTSEGSVEVVRVRRLPSLPPMRWYEDHLDSVPLATFELLRREFDVAHAFHPAYAFAALRARRLGGPPVAFSFHGVPTRDYLVHRRYRLEMMLELAREAAACTVLSKQASDAFERYLLTEPRILPGGVDLDAFGPTAHRWQDPTVVCAASLGDPRKGGELLLAAFEELRRTHLDARLRLVHTPDPFMSPLTFDLPDGACWVEAPSTSRVAAEYGAAHASVLPSVGEAFGLVALEALASGTPVVAARGEAPADLFAEGTTGAVFEPGDVESLAAALGRALELGLRDETREACRESARQYDWRVLAGAYEQLYEAAVDAAGSS